MGHCLMQCVYLMPAAQDVVCVLALRMRLACDTRAVCKTGGRFIVVYLHQLQFHNPWRSAWCCPIARCGYTKNSQSGTGSMHLGIGRPTSSPDLRQQRPSTQPSRPSSPRPHGSGAAVGSTGPWIHERQRPGWFTCWEPWATQMPRSRLSSPQPTMDCTASATQRSLWRPSLK